VDLLVSGVNDDFNLGYDVNYSGTVGAALEGASMGVASIAISTQRSADYDWALVGDVLLEAIDSLKEWAIPLGVALNVNVPSGPKDLRPVFCHPAKTANRDIYLLETGPDGRTRYVRAKNEAAASLEPEPGSDLALAKAGRVTVSPLQGVSSHPETLNRLRAY
jgi:5'-nucleotidase